jgi:glutathione peroxidase
MLLRSLLLILAVLAAPAALADNAAKGSPTVAYDFDFIAIEGHPLPLSQYRGQPLLVVNTASFCGFTPQYTALQEVWQRYRDRGLVVLGVPSNDFGGQEPGSETEIKTFCETNFDIDFPMTRKQTVRGPDAHPLYRWLAAELGAASVPKWNFHKYLIGRDGRPLAWFATGTEPTAPAVAAAIEQALAAKPGS